MIFNSLPFLAFAALFFPIYFALKGRARLWFCLLGSYFFYGWWDWRFLSLIITSTFVDYYIGLRLENTEDPARRKGLLRWSILVNLGFLGFFKYFNFFIGSFEALAHSIGWEPGFNTLHIILPVGISFYTFQSMSYTIDVYYRKIPVEHDFLRFATYISFFPQLVAGPIVRARDFLPQFQTDKKFEWDRLIAGSGQVLWGFFKKVAVADSLAPFVEQCFNAPESFSSLHLLIGVVFYSFQIYCDFSGYSDIAIGLARILGFDFPQNFRTPYFSKDFSEFWTRWHITLSSWLRDYLYIPLGGNRNGTFMTYRNLMLTMLLGGLWHGASWVFVFWGFLHGTYLVVQRLFGKHFGAFLTFLKTPGFLRTGINIFIVYTLTSLAWIFFRSPDFETAMHVLQGIATFQDFTFASVINKFIVLKGFILIALLLSVEIADFQFDFDKILVRNPAFRVASFAVLLWLIAFFGTFGSNAFIYFQF
ncbi:MAG: MBOAT family protein [Bacteroidetes bacterium]|nr:MAG: MBOAT family protein [Bacteroidota bacterium]